MEGVSCSQTELLLYNASSVKKWSDLAVVDHLLGQQLGDLIVLQSDQLL